MPVTQQGPAAAPYTKASGLTDGNTMRVVLADDSPGGSGGAASNVNVTQVGGVATAVGTGPTTAGTLRVTMATDSPISISTDAINLNTDGLEGLSTAANALLTTINTNVSDLETLSTTINTNVSDIETLATSINSKIPALGQATMAASLPVVLASNQSTVNVLNQTGGEANSASITGVGGIVSPVNITGRHSWGIQVTGTWVGTVVAEVSHDAGLNYNAIVPTYNVNTGASALTITTNGDYGVLHTAGATQVRVRSTAWTSGTAAIVLQATTAIDSFIEPITGTVTALPSGTQDVNVTQVLGAAVSVTNPLPSRATNGTAFLANLGETAATGNFVRLTDGTDTALITAAGELNTLNTNGAGASAVNIQDGGNSITVDGSLTTVTTVTTLTGTTTLTPGTSAANLGKAEDAVHTTGDVGVFSLGVANEAQTVLAADNDYTARATDTKGNSLTVGNVASDGVDAGNPVKIGAKARTTMPTAVADADRVDLIADKIGQLVTTHAIRDLRGNQVTTITSSTVETTIITAVAATFLDLYCLIITNTSATGCAVTIKDATAGTTRMVIQVPALETRGFTLPACDGHKQAVVNSNWTATCGTSVASIVVTALFKQNI